MAAREQHPSGSLQPPVPSQACGTSLVFVGTTGCTGHWGSPQVGLTEGGHHLSPQCTHLQHARVTTAAPQSTRPGATLPASTWLLPQALRGWPACSQKRPAIQGSSGDVVGQHHLLPARAGRHGMDTCTLRRLGVMAVWSQVHMSGATKGDL